MHGLPSLEQFIQKLAGPLASVSISCFLLRFAPVGPPSLHIQLSLGLCAGARVLCDLCLKFEK